jgi:stress-induced morphogen
VTVPSDCPRSPSFACGKCISYARRMSSHPTDFQGSVIDALRESIEKAIPESKAEVTGAGGHFSIDVVSTAFTGKTMLASQRLVYSAIAHLMSGDMAPVHAIDSLTTRVPGA